MPDEAVTEIVAHDHMVVVAVLRRSLDDASTHQLVDDVHTAAAQRPGAPIVLDLNRVRFAPSVALGSLVKLTKSFEIDRRRVILVGVDPRLMQSIRVTRLDQVLEIHPSLEKALGGGKTR